MKTVKDFLMACDSINSYEVAPDEVTQSLTTLKYSLLYLVSEEKLHLDDSIDEWKHYWRSFDLSDHYKVANFYLKRIGKPTLNYHNQKFHERRAS